jgi:hypothetical protein
MQIGVTLDVDEAERVADQLHRLVDQAREDGAE